MFRESNTNAQTMCASLGTELQQSVTTAWTPSRLGSVYSPNTVSGDGLALWRKACMPRTSYPFGSNYQHTITATDAYLTILVHLDYYCSRDPDTLTLAEFRLKECWSGLDM